MSGQPPPGGYYPPPPYPGPQGGYGGGYPPYPGGYPAGAVPPPAATAWPSSGLESQRPPKEQCFLIMNNQSHQVLEVEGASVDPGARVVTAYQNGQDNQFWFEDYSTGTIKSRLNLLCLDVQENNYVVMHYVVPGKWSQLWLRSVDKIQNRQDPSKVLQMLTGDVHTSIISAPPCSDSRQIWSFPGPSGAVSVSKQSPHPAPHPAPQPAPTAKPIVHVHVHHGPQSATRRYFYIQSEMHGKVLDVDAGNRAPGTMVIMWPRKSPPSDNQLWYQDDQGIIHSKLTDFVLQPSGHGIWLQPYTGKPNENWTFIGKKIALQHNPNKCLIIAGENGSDGVKLSKSQYKASSSQHWILDYLHTPRRYFYIRSEMHGKVLDVDGGNHAPGTMVIMWPRKSPPSDNQLWYLDDQGIIHTKLTDFVLQPSGHGIWLQPYRDQDNTMWAFQGNKIVLKKSPGHCLDISRKNKENGAKLCQFQYKASVNQHWALDYI